MSSNLDNNIDIINDNISTEDNIDIDRIISLKSKIINLSKNDMIEIFKIIKNNNNSYTENKNGIFINMNKLSSSTINEIENLLKFLSDKKNNFEQDTVFRNNIKDIVENVVLNSDSTNKLNYDNQNTKERETSNEIINDLKSDGLSFDKIIVPEKFNQLQYKMLGLNK
tara:strand:+ start:258 stop:761 length:504 start_codon:yes stop_codon:yes gene_type:complete